MLSRLRAMLAACLVVLLGFGQNRASVLMPGESEKPTAEELKKAQTQVQEDLAKLKSDFGQVQTIPDDVVVQTFPKHLFFSVVFPQFPVARQPEKPLKASVIYAVPRGKDGKLQLLTDDKELEAFFRDALGAVREDGKARDVAFSWLKLSPVFSQDGFYKFELMDDSIKVTAEGPKRTVTGKVVVMAGGNGEIAVNLRWDEAGKLAVAEPTVNLKRGVRPKCQATKLLDPDPIVRAIAEQDILIMGRAAKHYLDEQRAKARPELQQAIDQIWKRIGEEDR